jgi:Tfp pilus assembly protein PilX
VATRSKGQIVGLPLRGFDGGLNLRDAWPELEPNETPNAYNVIYDERGAVVPRLGIVKLNGASLLPQPPGFLYYSQIADAILAYIPADGGSGKLYKSTDGGVTWSSVYAGFTPGADGAIVDFNNRVVVCNTLDGVYSFPADLAAPTHTTGGVNSMEEARGSICVAWRNRVIVAGDPRNDSTHSTSRIHASAIANELVWNDPTQGSWTNDLREVDDQPITTIGDGQGVDINQKPSLYVCKKNSAYRVNDSETGQYTTLHIGAGACAATAIATVLGRIVTINDTGMWMSDGIQTPVRVSDKITPLFEQDFDLTTMHSWSAGVQRDRIVFNVTRLNSSRLQIEYHPLVKWLTVHKGMSLGPMTVYTKNTRKLIGASATDGKVFEVGSGGTDDGVAITSFWSSKDFPLLNGREVRLRSLRTWGRGAFDIHLRIDYSRGDGDLYPFDFTSGGFIWDVDYWDQDSWGDLIYVTQVEQPLEEVCRNVQIVIQATSSSTAQRPALLDDGAVPEVGLWGLYEALFQFVPVGLG